MQYITKKNIQYFAIFSFVVWMTFFDANSFLYQRKNNNEIKELEKSVKFYKEEIRKNKELIKKMSIQRNIDRFAREKYNFKKKNETLYLISYDTIEE